MAAPPVPITASLQRVTDPTRAPQLAVDLAAREAPSPIDLETYYTEAGMDYRAWSRGFNMHFGFWRWPQNPFALEPMLEEMSREVFRRLAARGWRQRARPRLRGRRTGPGTDRRAFGGRDCGDARPWQIAMAHQLGTGTPARDGRMASRRLHGDRSAGQLLQGAFSIEASCHAAGVDKELFVRECARLLVPGARLVVADGFMRRSDGMPRWYASLLRFMTRSWAVECFADLDAFTACLERHGFAVESMEDVS